MTDEESRKAFQEWLLTSMADRHDAWPAWQASAKYHTKRERERCWKIADSWMRNGLNAAQKATALMIMKEIERVDEPEPEP